MFANHVVETEGTSISFALIYTIFLNYVNFIPLRHTSKSWTLKSQLKHFKLISEWNLENSSNYYCYNMQLPESMRRKVRLHRWKFATSPHRKGKGVTHPSPPELSDPVIQCTFRLLPQLIAFAFPVVSEVYPILLNGSFDVVDPNVAPHMCPLPLRHEDFLAFVDFLQLLRLPFLHLPHHQIFDFASDGP